MSAAAGIRSGERVLLDSSALVYFIERHPRYGALARSIMERVQDGDVTAVVSSLALAELLVPAYRQGAYGEARRLRTALERYPHLETIEVDAEIADRAARLRASYSLRTPDAIHAATGLVRGVDWIVSNDHAFRRIESEGPRVWLFDAQLAPRT